MNKCLLQPGNTSRSACMHDLLMFRISSAPPFHDSDKEFTTSAPSRAPGAATTSWSLKLVSGRYSAAKPFRMLMTEDVPCNSITPRTTSGALGKGVTSTRPRLAQPLLRGRAYLLSSR